MYSEDLRWRVIWLRFGMEKDPDDIAHILQLSKKTVCRFLDKFALYGNVKHLAMGRPRGTTMHPYEQLVLMEVVLEHPEYTLAEIKRHITDQTGSEYDLGRICRTLRRFGVTRKMLRKVAAQQQERLRVEYMSQAMLIDPNMMIFIDESGFDRRLTRRWGYSFRGTRATIRRRQVWAPRVSAITAISLAGVVAIRTVVGGVKGPDFVAFIEDELWPILQPYNGVNGHSVVIMDNAAIHHVGPVSELIEDTAGSRLIYLPPYSPDLNPIEEAFSKAKAWARQNDIIFQCCPEDDLPQVVQDAIMENTDEDCLGYFQHAQYA